MRVVTDIVEAFQYARKGTSMLEYGLAKNYTYIDSTEQKASQQELFVPVLTDAEAAFVEVKNTVQQLSTSTSFAPDVRHAQWFMNNYTNPNETTNLHKTTGQHKTYDWLKKFAVPACAVGLLGAGYYLGAQRYQLPLPTMPAAIKNSASWLLPAFCKR